MSLSKIATRSVLDVMDTEVYTLSPETPVGAARMLADGKQLNHLLVVENEMLAGILCKEDLYRADQMAPVRDCMTAPVPCVGPDTTLGDAASIMEEEKLTCLGVVVGALLVGIITRAELTEVTEVRSRSSLRQGLTCVACGGSQGVSEDGAALDVLLCSACSLRVCRRTVRAVA